jgi:hypothetical protein
MLNGPMNIGATLPRTLKHHKPLIGDTLKYTVLTVQSASSLSPYELVSRLLAICRVQKPSILQSHSKTMAFGTYDLIASQTLPSSNSLDSYCCRRTQRTVDSYPNSFHTVEHELLAYPQGPDLLSQTVHRSVGDK